MSQRSTDENNCGQVMQKFYIATDTGDIGRLFKCSNETCTSNYFNCETFQSSNFLKCSNIKFNKATKYLST